MIETSESRRSTPNERTHPAIPTDCGICSVDASASQYAVFTLSMPSRVLIRIRVGWKCSPSGLATAKKLSS